jgi:uncharacterized protein YfaS (alpha-2-macroglobulin family)
MCVTTKRSCSVAKAYVLPRAGQRGIPVVSVNTSAVAIEIYRIGDRGLLNTPSSAMTLAQSRPPTSTA